LFDLSLVQLQAILFKFWHKPHQRAKLLRAGGAACYDSARLQVGGLVLGGNGRYT